MLQIQKCLPQVDTYEKYQACAYECFKSKHTEMQ